VPFFIIPMLLTATLIFIFGFVLGQSWDLGWQLPIGVSLTAIVATVSLVTTVHHSYAVRQHNKLQVRPHLVIDSCLDSTVNEGHHTYQLSIKNVGLGPAIVLNYKLSLGGVKVKDGENLFAEFVKLVNSKTEATGNVRFNTGYISTGEAIDKSQEVLLFRAIIPFKDRTFTEGRALAKKLAAEINFVIEYKCHYGSKFQIARNAPDLKGWDD
jgi:hypothetical protein